MTPHCNRLSATVLMIGQNIRFFPFFFFGGGGGGGGGGYGKNTFLVECGGGEWNMEYFP